MAHKILTVDDDPKVLKVLEHSLKREGFNVIQAESGLDALTRVKEANPDLVLLDLMMPEIDGFETLRKLREFSNIPVIILTARDEEVDKVVGFRMGADDYQVKPFSPVEVALRVKAVLKRVGDNPSKDKKNSLTFDQLVINYDKRMVKNSDTQIEMTPKEFELLWLMASHPNQVFTKGQLLDRIWDIAYEGDDNTVNVHIRRLRERLEENPSEPKYIKTVWGTGYKFCD
ncbi:MAG: response regulator transcription factor [Firmicutes bacterium]|nr:response regulator transcription factor [Bacillota bacterium]